VQVADGAATRVGVRERGATARAESHGAGAARVAKQALLRRRAAYFEEQVKGTGEGNVHAAESYVFFSSFSLLPPSLFLLPSLPPGKRTRVSRRRCGSSTCAARRRAWGRRTATCARPTAYRRRSSDSRCIEIESVENRCVLNASLLKRTFLYQGPVRVEGGAAQAQEGEEGRRQGRRTK